MNESEGSRRRRISTSEECHLRFIEIAPPPGVQGAAEAGALSEAGFADENKSGGGEHGYHLLWPRRLPRMRADVASIASFHVSFRLRARAGIGTRGRLAMGG